MDKSPHNEQNVLAMSDFQSTTGYAAIAQVEAYWEAVRGTRLLPKRSDIDPRGIERALENAFILERIAPGVARLRIAGSHLNDLMGMEVRGMPLTAMFTPAARTEISDLLEIVFQTPAISTLHLCSEGAVGRPPLEARLILLPLKSDLGDVSRVLGCFVAQGDVGIAPRRFDVMKKEVLHIAAGQPPAPAPTEAKVPKSPSLPRTEPRYSTGLSEDAPTFSGGRNSEGKRRPPYLRLIKTDE
ncbi:PAS domain family protein [Sulfitobacter noctilucicola]|uniref:PAS domain-containing protein n=1 Tax=Sulfitobacter noctilucicola TaxID=1342301 RepID=A0A7W6M8Y0_9RHOB|nr:PAS domain-containing protein [Sulfitobacter noctilucicola]KIN65008.1 PAS domain family protein [Sulfitobacter noctilucicola]MBB4173852.1 hypothetical protein [Sulfitobacter noctilucicola]